MPPTTPIQAPAALATAAGTLWLTALEPAPPDHLKRNAILLAGVLAMLITLLLVLIALTIFRRMIAAGRRARDPPRPGEPPPSAWKTAGARARPELPNQRSDDSNC